MNSFYRTRHFLWGLTFAATLSLVFSSCEVSNFTEEFSEEENSAPSISLVSPATIDEANTATGFIIRIQFQDDFALSTYNFSALDTAGVEILNQSGVLTGANQTIEIVAPVNLFPVGTSTFNITVSDNFGINSTVMEQVPIRTFQGNTENLFLSGSTFNGFQSETQMGLIADNIWQARANLFGVDGDNFILSDLDGTSYGDSDCDGIATIDDSGDIFACLPSDGGYLFTFNDATGEYSFEAFTGTINRLFIIGEYNGWGNSEDQALLIDDNLWSVDVDGAFGQWKFVENNNFGVVDYSDPECDGTAQQTNGPDNSTCGFEGNVNIIFNDTSTVYTITQL